MLTCGFTAHESTSEELALLAFSDERSDQETGSSQLAVTNHSESATGSQREQVNNFSFDKVETDAFPPKMTY